MKTFLLVKLAINHRYYIGYSIDLFSNKLAIVKLAM